MSKPSDSRPTEQLLEPVADKKIVDLLIDVSALPTKRTVGNGAFG